MNQNNGGTSAAAAAAAGSSSSTIFSTPQPPSRPQHIFTPASASSAPPQSTFLNTHTHSTNSHHTRAKRQQFPSTNTIPSQQLSFQSSHTLTTSGHGTAASGSTNNNYEHSFMIEQPLSTSKHTATKQSPSPYSTVRRDRLGTFESVMAVRSLGSGGKMASRRKNNHSDMVQQILSASVTANERVDGRDTSTSNHDDDDASDVSSLSDDGTTQGAAAAATTTNVASGGRTMASLLKKPRAIRKKKTIPIRPNPISGRQSSDHAASSIATTSITSATHTMETIECSFPSPLTAEINVEKVKSSKDLMGNDSIHRRSQSSISGVSFQLGGGGSNHRSPMIHDAWLSPASGYGGDSSSIQPKEGEDLIDITTDAPIDPFSGLIGMPSSSLSMCDNSFASGTTASLAEKPKPTSSFLRKPAMVSRSKTEEFDPFSKVKSEIPRAPRYLRDNPLLSKSRYRVRSSPKRQHNRAPSLDNACMIGSIAMSETNAAASVTTSTSADKEEEEDLVSNLPPIVQKTTEEADEDNDDSDSSYASFSEELNRKNRGKAFVGDVRNLMEKVLPVAKSNETKLQRSSEGCLT